MHHYNSFFRATNEQEFPGFSFLIYLCEPVVVIRYKGSGPFDCFESFCENVEELKWFPALAWVEGPVVREELIQSAWRFLQGERQD